MYTPKDREEYFKEIMCFFENDDLFEGVVQIGSGAIGYYDEYSDIDLMASYYNADNVVKAKNNLVDYLKNIGADYLWERQWSKTTIGVSAYFKNGLDMDISFGPTNDIRIFSPYWKVILDKTGNLAKQTTIENEKFLKDSENQLISNNNVFRCLNGIRRCNIAVKRKDYIYAANMLNEARGFIVEIAIANEGLKANQFKTFSMLSENIQKMIIKSFPIGISENEIIEAKNNTMDFLLYVIEENKNLYIDDKLMTVVSE